MEGDFTKQTSAGSAGTPAADVNGANGAGNGLGLSGPKLSNGYNPYQPAPQPSDYAVTPSYIQPGDLNAAAPQGEAPKLVLQQSYNAVHAQQAREQQVQAQQAAAAAAEQAAQQPQFTQPVAQPVVQLAPLPVNGVPELMPQQPMMQPQQPMMAPQPLVQQPQQPMMQPQMMYPQPAMPQQPMMAPQQPMLQQPMQPQMMYPQQPMMQQPMQPQMMYQQPMMQSQQPMMAPQQPMPPQAGMEQPQANAAGQKPAVATDNKKLRIGDKLIALGLISKDQLQIALQEQRQRKELLGTVLVKMGFVTESALGEVLAESAGLDTFDPSDTMLDPNLLGLMPKDVCMRHKVIPVSQDKDGSVVLVMADVYDVLALDQARRHLPKHLNIKPVYCTEAKITEMISQYYQYEISIDGILKEIETGIREKNQLDGRQDGYVNPTVRLVNALLIDAIKQEASDIHFEPEGTFLRLRYRIDGKLQQVRSFHRDYWAAMCVRMKIMSGMNIAESRNPQDGRISFKALGREIDFRVATQPTVHGENIVLRILDKSKALVPLENLGFTDHNMNLLKRCLKRPEGIIIVTGPTGSGKTTTLYSMLNHINSIDVNIMTLEDPVEYQIPMIRQTNVREGSVDFNTGIKSLMRQDPDIIFVGEVRDEETALMSVRAALTGHQVFTTLHTNDALGAIPRLIDIGIPPHLLSGTLIATMAQRLARKLCKECKRPHLATEEECKLMELDPANPPTIHEAVGCEKCNMKGYRGRTAIIEILRVDEGLDELVATHATRNHMMEYALENGFVPMVQDGIAKVLSGEIDLKELIRTVDLTDRM